ncbi:MAG: hypothetical protein AB1482_07940 [Pseudomonadota bacterium]
MSRIRIFQFLVIISAVFYLAWYLLPYMQRNFPPHIQDLLDWGGYGSIAFTQHPLFYLSIGAAKLVSTLGLFLFLSWGRWLLLAVVAISIAMVPFSGMAVAPPLDSFVGSLVALTDGAILGLAFFSPIAESMRKDVR